MKIAISGSAGCRKTTLAHALAEHFELPVIEEQYEDLLANRDSPETFLAGIRTTLERKSAQEQEIQRFVSDRSAIDLLHLSLNRRLHKTHRPNALSLSYIWGRPIFGLSGAKSFRFRPPFPILISESNL